VGDGRCPVDDQRTGEDPQRIQAFAGQRHSAHEPDQQRPAGHPDRRADRQLQQELGGDAAGRVQARGRAGGQQAGHEGDADRVVGAGFAFQDGPAAAGDLAAPEHGEHHRRVGWGQRGAQQQRRPPVEVEQDVGERGQGCGGDEGAGNADPDHRAGYGSESPPADVHPAVEQDDRQRH
jgi:hypothetical protein